MTLKEAVDSLLALLGIVVSWPVVAVVFAIFFRKELRSFVPELVRRVRKAPGGWEFSEEEAFKKAIVAGAKELSTRPGELADFAKNQVDKLLQGRSMASLVEKTSLVGKKLLWVDDKPVNNTYEASLFKSMGAAIDIAVSTEEGLKAAENGAYDLIISDVRRIEGGVVNENAGYEFIEGLVRRGVRVPLIFYTATVKTLDKSRTRAAFGIAHRSAELMSLVVSALGR